MSDDDAIGGWEFIILFVAVMIISFFCIMLYNGVVLERTRGCPHGWITQPGGCVPEGQYTSDEQLGKDIRAWRSNNTENESIEEWIRDCV